MKIGIITYHRAYNYGAFLQAFALKMYIESLGHTASFIDYQSKEHDAEYSLISYTRMKTWSLKGKISYIIKSLFCLRKNIIRQDKMRKLQHRYLQIGIRPESSIKKLEHSNFDYIVYGSDQIWRKSASNPGNGFDEIYWGIGFNKAKKITYAPSMGIIELSTKDRLFIKSHLKNFDHLSARELDLKTVIETLTDKNVTLVLDPVFLIDQTYWIQFANTGINIHEPYLLVYNLMHSTEVLSLAKTIAKNRKLRIIEITGSVKAFKYNRNILQKCDACDFLSLIRNAEFVVTSSFHATAFSIIFRKNFYALGMNKNSGRVLSLLKQCNLESRLVDNINNLTISDTIYSATILNLEIASSKLFINNIFNEQI